MDKLILTPWKVKPHETIETVCLLGDNQALSIPTMRNQLKKVELNGKLILINDGKLAKIFKPDYNRNDHGIYYDLDSHPCYDLKEEIQEKESKLEKLTGKRLNTAKETLALLKKDYQEKELDFKAVCVFMEKDTAKRDYERFLAYDDFVDPVHGYIVSSGIADYFKWTPDVTEYILDIETTGLNFITDDLLMLSVKAVGVDEILVIENPTVEEVYEIFGNLEGKKVIGHNLPFDLSWLMYYVGLEYAPKVTTIDTMLLAHVAGERRLGLKHLSMMYGNFKGRRNTMDADEAYLVEDMLTTELLYEKFGSYYSLFAGRLVCEAVKTFSEAKVNGVVIDKDVLFQLRDEYKDIEENPYDFNINSNAELAQYLVNQGVPLFAKTENGGYSVAQKVLEHFESYEVVSKYLDYKRELNIFQKYIKPYCALEDFTIRPDIRLSGTETGRLSANNPNVQQIPNRSKFKAVFRSRFKDGLLLNIDLDRAELGIAAMLSGDEDYVEALTSQDFHSLVAAKTFEKKVEDVTPEERFTAKSVNFGGVLYGGSAKGIAGRINVDPKIVSSIQEWYKEAFPVLTNWIEAEKQRAVMTGQVKTYFGRTRFLHGLRRDQMERIGVNTAVQSVASDVMLYIVVRLSSLIRENGLHTKILFPVHDELLIDSPREELEQIQKLFGQAFRDILATPLGKLPLAKTLEVSGNLEWGSSWLVLKSKKYEPDGSLFISSLED